MIHSIKADRLSFKTINFKTGLNVVLADRTKESTKKDSRNGLGKSTLIEILHFCLGAHKGEALNKPKLEDWTFTLTLDLADKKYEVSRNTSEQNKIIIDGDCSNWPIKPEKDDAGNQYLTARQWNKTLGVLMFDIQLEYEYDYHPTFRSVISYIIRRNGQTGGYLSPFQQFKQQATWDTQVNSAYLLGLGWEFASQWQVLKDREKVLYQIKSEAISGVLSDLIGDTGELEATKIRLEDQVKQAEKNLGTFKVHEQYTQLEENSNKITRTIHDLVNQNINDKRILEFYTSSLKEEVDAQPEQVSKIYKEAGIIFSEKISKQLSNVLEFHEKIVKNRKSFLTSEMDRIQKAILKREIEIEDLDLKKAELMLTLKTHGALEEYVQLQAVHQRMIGELKDIKNKLENLRKFEEGKSAIIIELELLYQKTKADLNERQTQKEGAILTFNSYSQKLYEVPGTLSINIIKTGYKFGIKIERSGSHGFENMKIFCYDLMLAKLWAKKATSPRFLIHDSTIFADVDERQCATALQLAAEESKNENFQYICTMNSDAVPSNDFDADFNFDDFVVRKLTDATKDGGLLGIRF